MMNLKLKNNVTMRQIKEMVATEMELNHNSNVFEFEEVNEFFSNLDSELSIDVSEMSAYAIDTLIGNLEHTTLNRGMAVCGRFERALEYIIKEEIQSSLTAKFEALCERWERWEGGQFSTSDLRSEVFQLSRTF